MAEPVRTGLAELTPTGFAELRRTCYAELRQEYSLPDALSHVWAWFCELRGARGAGMYSLAPLSFQDIDAWARLSGHRPSPAEVGLLRQLDDVFREELNPK